MNLSLANHTILITGASRGLGRAMALELARAGATLALHARQQRGRPDRLDQLLVEVELDGGSGVTIRGDLREPDQVQQIIDQTMARLGRIDVLINNAGVFGGELGLLDLDPASWKNVLDTNLSGPFLCARAVIPHMLHAGHGTIVNMSSGAAVRSGFLNPAYGVSKAGLDRLTLALHAEFGTRGIACVSLSPPVSATEPIQRLYSDQELAGRKAAKPEVTAQAVRRLLEQNPMRYSGQVVSVRDIMGS
jgi:NAD(P)-dependent dehydrogenase (short-subunit alcohol dehydrogenase family)